MRDDNYDAEGWSTKIPTKFSSKFTPSKMNQISRMTKNNQCRLNMSDKGNSDTPTTHVTLLTQKEVDSHPTKLNDTPQATF
jgi:hypothetical protein